MYIWSILDSFLQVVKMAQLLSPVCTDSLKLQNPIHCFNSRSKFPVLGNSNFSYNNQNWSSMGRKRGGLGRIKVTYQDSAAASEDIVDDFYAVLGLVIFSLFSNFDYMFFAFCFSISDSFNFSKIKYLFIFLLPCVWI